MSTIQIIDSIDSGCVIRTIDKNILIGCDNHCIFKYDLKSKQKKMIAGSLRGCRDGNKSEAKFVSPKNLVLSTDNKKLFMVDNGNIRVINGQTGVTSSYSLNIFNIKSLHLSPDGKLLCIGSVDKITFMCIKTGVVHEVIDLNNFKITFVTFHPDGIHYLVATRKYVYKRNIKTGHNTIVFESTCTIWSLIISQDCQSFVINFNAFFGEINKNDYVTFYNFDSMETIDHFVGNHSFIRALFNNTFSISSYERGVLLFKNPNQISNFETFIQMQLSHYSFLPKQIIKNIVQ
jgi:hypothetical protein